MNNQKHLACDTPDEYPEGDYFAKWEAGYDPNHPFQRFWRWLQTSWLVRLFCAPFGG